MNRCGTVGNLLYPFYKRMNRSPEGPKSRIQGKVCYNHEDYGTKHVAGEAGLQNVHHVDGLNIVFVSDGSRNILSDAELAQAQKAAYNLPQSTADIEMLEALKQDPQGIRSRFAPRNNDTVFKESEELADHILSDIDWGKSKIQREMAGRDLPFCFDIPKLIRCLRQCMDECLTGGVVESVLSKAWRETEQLQKSELAMHSKAYGDEHALTLRSMSDLVLTYQAQGRFEQAKELQKDLLRVCSSSRGIDDSTTLTAMSNLAFISKEASV